MKRRTFLHLAAPLGAGLLGPVAAHAQDAAFPQRPLRLVVPFPAGGGADSVARLLPERPGARLGQPVLVDNRAGASGSIAALAVARAPADGYTLMLNTNGHTILPSLQKTEWDPVKDFAPLSEVAGLPLVIFTKADSRITSIGDLIAAAKRNPGKLSYGSSGSGGTLHLGMEIFAHRAGIKLLHVPYKGNAPMATALIGGEIDLYMDTMAVSVPLVRQGRLKALATTSATRVKLLPDVPTLAESGLPGFAYQGWQGLFAPAATPAPVLARLAAEIGRVMATPAVRQKIEELGYEPRGNSPREFAATLDDDLKLYRQIIAQAGIKGE